MNHVKKTLLLLTTVLVANISSAQLKIKAGTNISSITGSLKATLSDGETIYTLPGYKISRITVAKYMKELGLRSKLSKKFKVTTNSKHNYLVVENALDRNFSVPKPSKVWVSDITYIQPKEGFLYLTTIIDLYDRKIIGWSLSNGMSAEETSLAA